MINCRYYYRGEEGVLQLVTPQRTIWGLIFCNPSEFQQLNLTCKNMLRDTSEYHKVVKAARTLKLAMCLENPDV